MRHVFIFELRDKVFSRGWISPISQITLIFSRYRLLTAWMSSKAKVSSFFGILTSNCQSKMELHIRNFNADKTKLYEVVKTGSTSFFFIGNTFIRNTTLKMTRNQEKVKQHPDAERLLFENDLLSLSTLSSKNNRRYSKNVIKTSTSF